MVVGCAGSGKTTLAREVAMRLDARHIERDALGDDEAPGFAALVDAAVEAAGRRWVFDGAPYNAEALVYPHADALVGLDYPRRVVWRRVVARSLRLWLTRRGDGAHTTTSPPWRWWAPTHPVRWAAQTHAARHEEGLASRAVGLAARWALSRPDVAAVELRIDIDMMDSRHVTSNAGFVLAGTVTQFVPGTGETCEDLRCILV